MEQLFYRYNPWWEQGWDLSGVIPRDKALETLISALGRREITLLSGLRRVGKTTLMRSIVKHLLDAGADPGSVFYISLDDYLLKGKNLPELVDEFRKIRRIGFSEKIFLFFDEVTYIPDHEQQLKNIFDSQNVKIFASSSSASLLRRGKPFLTGRNRVIEIAPLDFDEFIRFKGYSVLKSDSHLEDAYFEEYLQTGGIPKYVLTGEAEYLKDLVDDIIMKDIAAVHGVRETARLKDMFLLLMERSGKSISINKVANILATSPDTIKRYLSHFEDSFLISTLMRCGKTNENLLAPKKIYAADLGIRNLFTGFRDKGSLFENYLYNKLKSFDPCYYFVDGIELDFLIAKNILIEAKYLSELTGKQRELFDEAGFPAKFEIDSFRKIPGLLEKIKSITNHQV